MMMLLMKVTVLLAGALCLLPLLRRSGAALRHLICAMALSGALVLPLTLAFAPHAIALHLPVVFSAAANSLSASAGARRLPWLQLLWAAGAGALLLRLLLGHVRLTLVMRTAQRTAETAPVYLAAGVSVPLACGLFRPAILLPSAAEAWPLTQRSAALRHELAHIERKDLWTSLMARIACAVYWFHPLVWAVAVRMHQEQEIACDDAVLSAGFEPANYAEALLATARHLTSTSLIGCHMLNRQTLKHRIARLLDRSLPRTTSTTALRLAAALSVVMLASLGLTYAEQQTGTPDQQEEAYKVGDGVTAPRVLSKVEVQYTDEARDAKISGTVLLSVVVGTDGAAHQINVLSTPDAGLSTKAVEAVQQWTFAPGTLNGEPVPVKARIEVNFKLL
ncbi:MAG: M56 family metallopeptidase [Acidobacteriota bacterium]